MPRFIKFLLFIPIFANAENTTRFELQSSLDGKNRVDISIFPSQKSGFYKLKFKTVEKEFSEKVIDTLLDDLFRKTPAFSSWKNEFECRGATRYKVTYQGGVRVFCKNEKLNGALENFKSTVSLILRD